MSAETKWTPGPWMLDEVDNIVYGPNEVAIAEVALENGFAGRADGPGVEPGEANARLIAEAPALVEALEACVDLISAFQVGMPEPGQVEVCKIRARAILARVKGGDR